MTYAQMYSPKIIQIKCTDVKISPKQRESAKEWLELLKNGTLKEEVANYPNFMHILLRDLLEYPEKEISYEAKNVEFSFKNKNKETAVCFEAKGTKTEDLFAYQSYGKKEQENPVIQTLSNMARFPARFGVATNYRKFILLDLRLGNSKCHKFDFYDIENNDDKLKEFIKIFSYHSLVNSTDLDDLYDVSITEEKEFTNEFYKLFHETRLMLIKEFQENPLVSRTEAIYYTQLFLNRLIFIFFVGDRGFISVERLFTNRILKLLDSDQSTEHSKKVYAEITELFVAFDKGDKGLGVFGFNGGLFSGEFPDKISFSDRKDPNFFSDVKLHSKLLKSTKLNEKDSKIIDKQKHLNPIIYNLLLMDSFNFSPQTTSRKTEATQEVSINILGHIFEQSISDLEELKQTGVSRRKKEGVYYTPQHITDFVCRNTIIPYLSKSNVSTVHELINEYVDDIEKLEKKFSEIKILDPACGSGAFLVKAIDILLEIHKEIQIVKESTGKYSTGGQFQLTKWNEEEEIKNIIENNIYGVDINLESIGITQLSLFLKLASNHRKLSGLSKNIKVGNSLIENKTVDVHAFCWSDEFPEILGHLIKDNGFDIVVGNPPWQIVKPSVDEFFAPMYDARNSTEKFSLLTKIKKNNFVKKSLEDPHIQKEWKDYEDAYKKQMNYFNDSGKYPHQISLVNGKKNASDLNLYKLFVEKSSEILRTSGVCGLVVPAGIYSDLGSKGLRELIFKNNKLNSLVSFVNNGIFEDVHYQFKFCIIVFEKNSKTGKFKALFNQKHANYLEQFNERSFEYDVDLIEKSSPNSLSLLECSSKEEETILEKMYQFPMLEDTSTWDIKARSEFHLTGDSDLFHTSKIGYPLFEGKMIHQFRNDLSPPRYWIEANDGITSLEKKETSRIKRITKDKNKTVKPELDCNQYRLVWRDITNATNERGMIVTILPPKVFLGNTLNYVYSIYFDGEKYNPTFTITQLVYLCGILNSFPVDFVLRHKISSHANIFYVKELPIPTYDSKNILHKKICENSAKLICCSKEFDILAKEIGVTGVKDPDERNTLIAQISALSAKIYGFSEDELKIILQNFPIVNESQKELVLEEFALLK